MPHDYHSISPIEKIISIISYPTMGIAGLIWYIIACFLHRKLRYFLMYNITQSIIIAIFLAVIKLLSDLILPLISMIPFVDIIAACINFILSIKVLTIPILHLSFSIFQIFLNLLFLYIITGIILGRIFYIPSLTDFCAKIMKSYI